MIQYDEVKQLLEGADDHTLTMYVTTDNAVQGNQGSHPGWQTFVKKALRELDREQGKTDAWSDVRRRAESFFEDLQPTSKGYAAIFTQSDQFTFELPMQVDEYAEFGKPNVLPLLWAMDEYEPYLVVMVDTEKAYIIIGYLGNAEFRPETTLHVDFGTEDFGSKDIRVATQTGEYVVRGSPVDEFQDFVKEHESQLYRKLADEIPGVMSKYKARRLVLAGNEQSGHAVKKYLPELIANQVVTIKGMPNHYNPQQILADLQDAALAFERQDEIKLVGQVIDFAKAGGRGALGWQAVRNALEMRQVDLLILPWPVPDDAQATELILKTFASGGKVELVHGEAAASVGGEGGVAAQLYYAL
jgi:hypothetical protein